MTPGPAAPECEHVWQQLRIIKTKQAIICFFFFFSSRRRNTRCIGDWSSDVCSSDLCGTDRPTTPSPPAPTGATTSRRWSTPATDGRSEERRVGKEGRPRGSHEG